MSLEVVGKTLYVGTSFSTIESQVSEGNGALYAFYIPESSPITAPTPFVLSNVQLILIGILVAVLAASVIVVVILKRRI